MSDPPPATPDREGEQNKPTDVSHAARSGTMQILTIAAQAMLTVTHVLLARLFGRAVFGSYQTSVAILEILTRAGTGGADKGMLRYIAGHRARGEPDLVRSALGTGLRLCLLIAGGTAALLMLFAPEIARVSHEPTMIRALRLMAPAAVFTGCMWVLVQASLAAKVTRANFWVRGLGEPLFLLTAGLGAALFGRSLEHLAAAHLMAAVATFLLATVVVGRVFGAGELTRALKSPALPGFAGFALPLGLAELMNSVLQRADIVLLTMFVGTDAAAVYAAAEFITRIIANARYVFDSVAAPMFSEAIHLHQRERLRGNLVMMTRWVISAAAPIAVTVLVLRHELLSLYGVGFQSGAVALCVLAVGHLVNSTLGLAAWVLLVDGRSRLLLLNNVMGAVVNVVIGFTLIPRFGLLGTAIAALGSIALVQAVVLIEVYVIHKVHPFARSLLKPLVAGFVALVLQVLLGRLITSTGFRVLAVIAVGLATYLGVLALLGFDTEDRRLLSSAASSMKRKFGRRSARPVD